MAVLPIFKDTDTVIKNFYTTNNISCGFYVDQ